MIWRKDGAVELGYRLDGSAQGPVVILGPSLGTELSLFDRQIDAFGGNWRIVRHDLRGHGTSPSSNCPFTLADMAADVIALADKLKIERFSYVGVSISGAVAQALAVDYPQRIDRLVICASAAHWPDSSEWASRAERVRREGTDFLVGSRPGIWFSDAFGRSFPAEARRLTEGLRGTGKIAYAACCDAIREFDARDRLGRISAPTIVVVGEHDPATPVERAKEIAGGINGSRLSIIPGGLHLPNVENSPDFNALMMAHLNPGRSSVR